MNRILEDIGNERARQDQLKAAGKFQRTCADDMTHSERLAVLAEEFGEVAREVCEQLSTGKAPENLRTELVQVSAVCVAWIEALDAEFLDRCARMTDTPTTFEEVRAQWAEVKAEIERLREQVARMTGERSVEHQRVKLRAYAMRESIDIAISQSAATPAEKALIRQNLAHLGRFIDQLAEGVR